MATQTIIPKAIVGFFVLRDGEPIQHFLLFDEAEEFSSEAYYLDAEQCFDDEKPSKYEVITAHAFITKTLGEAIESIVDLSHLAGEDVNTPKYAKLCSLCSLLTSGQTPNKP